MGQATRKVVLKFLYCFPRDGNDTEQWKMDIPVSIHLAFHREVFFPVDLHANNIVRPKPITLM